MKREEALEMIGKVCRCNKGHTGFVTEIHPSSPISDSRSDDWLCRGTSLDGSGRWESRVPTIVYDSMEGYIMSLVAFR